MITGIMIFLFATAATFGLGYVLLHRLTLRESLEVAGKSLVVGFAIYGAASLLYQILLDGTPHVSIFLTGFLLSATKFGTDLRYAKKAHAGALAEPSSP